MSFITDKKVAAKALVIAEDSVVVSQTFDKSYSGDFFGGTGDQIRIRKYATVTAKDFTGTVSYDKIVEDYIYLNIDQHKYYGVDITAKEQVLDIVNFTSQVTAPCVRGIIRSIEETAVSQIKKVQNYASNISGVPSSVEDLALINAQCETLNFPMDEEKWMLVNPLTAAKIASSNDLFKADTRADSGAALKNAEVGTVMDLTVVKSNMLPVKSTSTATTGTSGGAIIAVKESVSIPVSGLTSGETLHDGDILEFTNTDGSVVKVNVSEDFVATGSADTVSVYWVSSAIEDSAPFVVKNVGFGCAYNSNAFAMVTAQLPPLAGKENEFIFDTDTGVGMRIAYGSFDLANKITFDCIYGCEHTNRQFAVRFDLEQ